MESRKPYPIHPFAFALFPILALLARNIGEVELGVAIRPAIISLVAATTLLLLAALLLRPIHRAAIIVTLILIAFFAYGHVYELVKNTIILGFNLGRHRYLFPATLVLLGFAAWWMITKLQNVREATRLLNVVGIALLLYPTLSVVRFSLRSRSGLERASQVEYSSSSLSIPESGELPDIYYIILDTYTRGDALLNDFGLDTSPFLDELRSHGFYVADCSRPNYSFTLGSITATLNLDYLSGLEPILTELELGPEAIWVLMKQSRVRRQLEEIGYQTVAFETGYEWSRIRDADFYLALDKDPITIQGLIPFERLLLDSTAFVLYTHSQIQSSARQASVTLDERGQLDHPHADYVERQRFILAQVPEIPEIDDPTFAFIHILIPHVPYVFDPAGNVRTDPAFYSGERTEPVDEAHWLEGYIGEVEFINRSMLDIVERLIAESEIPPVIVIQGDHGLREENRLQILNAMHLPGLDQSQLYDTLSPVNSFRIIFNHYFGTDFELLPDLSYNADEPEPRPETSIYCLQ